MIAADVKTIREALRDYERVMQTRGVEYRQGTLVGQPRTALLPVALVDGG